MTRDGDGRPSHEDGVVAARGVRRARRASSSPTGGSSQRVWGDTYGDDVEVLRVFVSQLRRKIEPDPRRPQAIVTEPGIGYRWRLRPAELTGAASAPVT